MYFSDVLKDIDAKADEYIRDARSMIPDIKSDHLETIQRLFNKSREYGDDKVQLAMQTYEMVNLLT